MRGCAEVGDLPAERGAGCWGDVGMAMDRRSGSGLIRIPLLGCSGESGRRKTAGEGGVPAVEDMV